MTIHNDDDGRSEVPSDASQERVVNDAIAESIIETMCDADGMPYELTTHYMIYGPALPSEERQAHHRLRSRDTGRAYVMIDYRLIE